MNFCLKKFTWILATLFLANLIACDPPEEEQKAGVGASNSGADKYFSKMNDGSGEEVIAEAEAESEKIIQLVSLELRVTDAKIVTGLSRKIKLVGLYSDDSVVNLSKDAKWVSGNKDIADFIQAGAPGLLTSISAGVVKVTAKYFSKSVSMELLVIAPVLIDYEISPSSLVVGSTQRFKLTGIYSDNSTVDFTEQAIWSSNNNLVAKMNSDDGWHGYVDGVSMGTFNLGATYNGVQTSRIVTSNLMKITSLEIISPNSTMQLGSTMQLEAKGYYENGADDIVTTSVKWTASSSVASVGNTLTDKGKVHALAGGPVTITAESDGVSATYEITVITETFTSFEILPAKDKVPLGSTQAYTLIGTRPDDSTQDLTDSAAWAISNEYLGVISNDPGTVGLFSTYAPGNLTISALYGVDVTTKEVTVTNPALVSIELDATKSVLPCGIGSTTYSAKGIYSDGTDADISSEVIWSVDNANIATISNSGGTKGVVTTVIEGDTTIIAKKSEPLTGEEIIGSKNLKVSSPSLTAYEVRFPSSEIPDGATIIAFAIPVYTCPVSPEIAANEAVSWTSSNTIAAFLPNVVGEKGTITTGSGIGTNTVVTISVELDGKVGSADLTIKPKEAVSMQVSFSTFWAIIDVDLQAFATVVYSDGSTDEMADISGFPGYTISWATDKTDVLTVDSIGNLTAITEGNTPVRASLLTPSGGTIDAFKNINVRSPCASGERDGWYCWFLGNLGESCLDVCAAEAGTYHDATVSYIGTGPKASGQRCENVLMKLGFSSLGKDNQTAPDGQGVGCAVLNYSGITATRRYTSEPTTDTAAHALFQRVCACRQP